jgi:phosphoglycolate phosphatase
MKPTVLLFDIDGTLVTTAGAGRRALERAFERTYGASGAFPFRLDGMTDRAIVRQGLAQRGLPCGEAEIDALLDLYLEILKEEVAAADARTYRVHAGIERALDEASARTNTAIGLGTGNVREGARVKLTRVGLYGRFAFGGFGCDHENRVELIRRGAERGAQHLDVPMKECRVVVIGDTPKDVAAAKGIGAECLGVGTGMFTPAQLTESGADAAFNDLSEHGALVALLGRD